MVLKNRTATWLELATVAAQGKDARLGLHAVSDCGEQCVVLMLDGRPLHDGEGRLTVFHNLEVLQHFLACCGCAAWMQQFERPDAAADAVSCGDAPRCLDLGRNGRLVTCSHARHRRTA